MFELQGDKGYQFPLSFAPSVFGVFGGERTESLSFSLSNENKQTNEKRYNQPTGSRDRIIPTNLERVPHSFRSALPQQKKLPKTSNNYTPLGNTRRTSSTPDWRTREPGRPHLATSRASAQPAQALLCRPANTLPPDKVPPPQRRTHWRPPQPSE